MADEEVRGSDSTNRFRPDLYIVARMIEKLLQSKEGRLKRTQLQMKTGLNWSVFAKYLDLLVEKKVLAVGQDEEGVYVTATLEGRKAYRDLVESIRAIMGERWMEESGHLH